jgi:endogenous inhibitor of DNA gyrase (YacG/DUF329 family)
MTHDWKKEDEIAENRRQEAKENNEINLIAKLGLIPFRDGNQWCFLLGKNIQEGICGFGDSPYLAMLDFNNAFYKRVNKDEIGEVKKIEEEKIPKIKKVRGKKVIVKCKNCKTEFEAREADRKRGWAKFCSKSCKAEDQEKRTGQMGNYLIRQSNRYSSARDDIEDSFHPHDEYALGQEP